MKALAEVQVVPIGEGVSVRRWVQRAHEVLEQQGLKVELHGFGTNVEGEMAAVLDAVRTVHETLHAEGCARLATNVKLGTRTDKEPSLSEKLF